MSKPSKSPEHPLFRAVTPDVNFPALEERILGLWNRDDAFRQSVERRSPEKSFAFFDGPPFATGLPHYGHLLAGTIKDIVPRYWTMRGYRVERRFGWDCHGLPIENLIQDELKLHTVKDIRDHGVGAFNEACRAGVLKYTKEWRRTVSRMGRWVDFDNEYKTMDADFMESVWWVFQRCFDLGLIYQGWRIQPYSPALATSLSNFEVNQNYKMRQDPSVTLAFALEGSDEQFLVWTTTPWTLPSNMAIAVKPDLDYALVERKEGGGKFWVADSRRGTYFGEADVVLRTVKGAELAGRRYKPLFEYAPYMSENQYTILAADFVSDADGTGAVHIAPSFGEEDFQLGKAEGLGLWDPLDADGRFTDLVPEWKGVGAKDADKDILRKLKADGRLYRHETLEHSYP
ncbi:MAG TPA: class I tRNA ligase family protein, partial [Fibrobacteria bacterium]|nr:class I tRNA ligase family protein [Fibrobacteria bacterium]